MNPTEVFAILKYGVNILLVGLGFLSFEDISHESKPDQQRAFQEKVNYVEKLHHNELELLTNTYYADNNYFIDETNYSKSLLLNKPTPANLNMPYIIDICRNNGCITSKEVYILKGKYANHYEIIIIQDNEDSKNASFRTSI
jgi:hypothetical protein